MQNNYLFLLSFNLEQFTENGLFNKWIDETQNEIPTKFNPNEKLSKLDLIKNSKLSDLQSIFFISLIGLNSYFIIELLFP
jgi:hypothetical protein